MVATRSLSMVLLLSESIITNAFISSSRVDFSRARVVSPPVALQMIETINLDSLDDDHEAEGTRLAESIAGWLDLEWCPQEVHAAIAEDAKQTYVKLRSRGEDCVSSIMHETAENLYANWDQFDKDAFVGPYDVANYVSDYLSVRSGELSGLKWCVSERACLYPTGRNGSAMLV